MNPKFKKPYLDYCATIPNRTFQCNTSEIRSTILKKLDYLSSASLVIERSRDIDLNVRKAVYDRLASDPNILQNESISDIVEFFETGFNERSLFFNLRDEAVKAAFEDMALEVLFPTQELLLGFLKEIKFTLDSTKVLQELLIKFFNRNSKIKLKCSDINWEELGCSGAFFVRVYCQNFARDEDRIEILIPSITFWTNTILAYIIILMKQDFGKDSEFLLAEMLKTAKFLNMSDESGRRKLCELLSSFILM